MAPISPTPTVVTNNAPQSIAQTGTDKKKVPVLRKKSVKGTIKNDPNKKVQTPQAPATGQKPAITPVYTNNAVQYSAVGGVASSTSIELTSEELSAISSFDTSNDGVPPFLTAKAVIGSDGKSIIGQKYIDYNHIDFSNQTKKLQINAKYIDGSSNVTMKSMKKLLLSLYLKKPSEDTSVLDMQILVRSFQSRAEANGIYAKFFEISKEYSRIKNNTAKVQVFKNKYKNAEITESGVVLPVVNDGKPGRQTLRAAELVYRLGKLSEAFGLVDSFDEYIGVFNNPPEFRKMMLILKDAINKSDRLKNVLVKSKALKEGEVIDDINNGTIKGNVGETIIALQMLIPDKVGKPDLDNISMDPLDPASKAIITDVIGPEEAAKFRHLPAVEEAKTVLYSLIDENGDRFYGSDKFDGTWDADFENALFKATGERVINRKSATKLIELAKARLEEINKDLTDPKSALNLATDQSITDARPSWSTRYGQLMADTRLSLADKLYWAEKDVATPYETALNAELQMLRLRLTDLHNTIGDAGKENTALNFLATATDIDKLELIDVMKKLKPTGTLLDMADLRSMQSLSTLSSISDAGKDIAKMIETLDDKKAFVESHKRSKRLYVNNQKLFTEEVDRLRKAIEITIQNIEANEKKSGTAYAVYVGKADDLYKNDILDTAEFTNIEANRSDVHYLDFKKADDIIKQGQMPEEGTLVRKFLSACGDVNTKIENKDLLAKAKAIYEERIIALRRNEPILMSKQEKPLPLYLSFNESLEAEIEGHIVSYASMSIIQAYLALDDDTKYLKMTGETKGILKGATEEQVNSFIKAITGTTVKTTTVQPAAGSIAPQPTIVPAAVPTATPTVIPTAVPTPVATPVTHKKKHKAGQSTTPTPSSTAVAKPAKKQTPVPTAAKPVVKNAQPKPTEVLKQKPKSDPTPKPKLTPKPASTGDDDGSGWGSAKGE